MNVPFFIARRYLLSQKSRNVVNLISIISMIGVAVGTMALVIVLSAINGLEDLVESLYSHFDAEIRVEPASGKTFEEAAFPWGKLEDQDGIALTNRCLEETVLLKYGENQAFATLKGVDEAFVELSRMDSLLWTGTSTLLDKDEYPFAILGYFIARNLDVNLNDMFQPMQVYAANREAGVSASMESAFLNKSIYASGIFAVNAEIDNKYAVVPLSFVRELLGRKQALSAVEVGLVPGTNLKRFQSELQASVGPEFTVRTRYELNELLYKTNNTEKWFTFMILAFILVIATFNVIGSLTMLIIDKKQDIFILNSIGANRASLQRIFFLEGFLISAIGGAIGLAIGLILCFLQIQFGMIQLEGMLVDAYPIVVEPLDIVAILLLVMFIGTFSALLPARYVVRKYVQTATEAA